MSDEKDQFDFDRPDLAPMAIRVKYRGVEYQLREASEEAAVKYRDVFVTKARFNEEGKFAGVGAISDGEATIVAMCLFEKLPDGTFRNTSATKAEVMTWGSKVVKPLFNWVRKHSDLVEQPETPEELEEQIGRLTARLVKLRKGEQVGPKDAPPTGHTT